MNPGTADLQSQPLTATSTSLLAYIDLLRSAFDGMGTSIFLADRDLNLVYMNCRARTVLLDICWQLLDSASNLIDRYDL